MVEHLTDRTRAGVQVFYDSAITAVERLDPFDLRAGPRRALLTTATVLGDFFPPALSDIPRSRHWLGQADSDERRVAGHVLVEVRVEVTKCRDRPGLDEAVESETWFLSFVEQNSQGHPPGQRAESAAAESQVDLFDGEVVAAGVGPVRSGVIGGQDQPPAGSDRPIQLGVELPAGGDVMDGERHHDAVDALIGDELQRLFEVVVGELGSVSESLLRVGDELGAAFDAVDGGADRGQGLGVGPAPLPTSRIC